MPLDIGLAASKTIHPYPAMRISFDDDGYYWFCYPFFEELKHQTGELIDLWGGAWFGGMQLDQLSQILRKIMANVEQMSEEWQVCVGQSIGSYNAPTVPQPVYKTVRRDELLALLSRFDSLVNEAITQQKWVACLGD